MVRCFSFKCRCRLIMPIAITKKLEKEVEKFQKLTKTYEELRKIKTPPPKEIPKP